MDTVKLLSRAGATGDEQEQTSMRTAATAMNSAVKPAKDFVDILPLGKRYIVSMISDSYQKHILDSERATQNPPTPLILKGVLKVLEASHLEFFRFAPGRRPQTCPAGSRSRSNRSTNEKGLLGSDSNHRCREQWWEFKPKRPLSLICILGTNLNYNIPPFQKIVNTFFNKSFSGRLA
jgi:hypothetical protein